MSNVKNVIITGEINFDVSHAGNVFPDEDAINMLGTFNMPCYGIRIRYGAKVPNSHGGTTARIKYEISGEEAVHNELLDIWLSALRRCGKINKILIKDVKNNEVLISWCPLIGE